MAGSARSDAGVERSDTDMAWLAHISDWQAETSDPTEFLDNLRYEIGAKEVYVFTPQGKVIGLPAGATPVDFAYAVHTEVGHRTMGAKVNGRLVPLDTPLSSGDSVEVFTSKNPDAGPSQDWLNFVTSTRAGSKIRQWFTKERRDEAIEQGKDAIARAMRKQNLPLQRLMSQDSVAHVAAQLRYETVESLYAAVGEGHVSTQSVIEKIVAALHVEAESDDEPFSLPTRGRTPVRTSDSGVLVRGAPDILVKLAKCCTPVPGDEIMGFITRGRGVSVHRSDCANAGSFADDQSSRLVDVEWDGSSTGTVFRAGVEVVALDRSRLLRDVANALSEQHVNIVACSTHTGGDRVAKMHFEFELADPSHLESVLRTIRQIDAVYDCYRLVPGRAQT